MGSTRRLTDQERRQIVRERAKGVSVSAISAALKVSPKTVYNVLSRVVPPSPPTTAAPVC